MPRGEDSHVWRCLPIYNTVTSLIVFFWESPAMEDTGEHFIQSPPPTPVTHGQEQLHLPLLTTEGGRVRVQVDSITKNDDCNNHFYLKI